MVLAGFFLLLWQLAAQTTQEPSIADAARANRAEKKATPTAGKVITNDSLGPAVSTAATANSSSSQPSPSEAPTADAASPAADSKSPAGASQPELSPADAEKLKAEVAGLKQQLKEGQSEVELMKRLVDLDKDAYFSQTDFARDTQGKAKLEAEQDDLKQKEEAFEKLKAKLLAIAPQDALSSSAEQANP